MLVLSDTIIRIPDIGTILQPGGIWSWLLVGLISGFLASIIVRGRGSGCIGNIIVGLIGALVGGFLISLLDLGGNYNFIGSVVVSFIGAAIFLFILRLFTGKGD